MDYKLKVELVVPYGGKLLTSLKESGPRLHHIAFKVDNIEEACITKVREGFKLLEDEPVAGVGGTKVNFILPQGRGVLIELVETPR
jgi:methylmalonyl-CoA/ethylmalonyl-CoA epimerase